MSLIILDISANTHKNDWKYLKKMLDELKKVDTGKHEIIIKHQLFTKVGDNIPLKHEIFEKAYNYAEKLGYKTTSSIFDKESLDYLLKFDVPFIKIANNRKLDYLIGEIPRKIPLYISYGNAEELQSAETYNATRLFCVSEYPATIESYEEAFDLQGYATYQQRCYVFYRISDHTTNFGLWYKYEPDIIEWHYKLEDSTGLDAGEFARTPAMLKEIL